VSPASKRSKSPDEDLLDFEVDEDDLLLTASLTKEETDALLDSPERPASSKKSSLKRPEETVSKSGYRKVKKLSFKDMEPEPPIKRKSSVSKPAKKVRSVSPDPYVLKFMDDFMDSEKGLQLYKEFLVDVRAKEQARLDKLEK
jgi:hypothetical protein